MCCCAAAQNSTHRQVLLPYRCAAARLDCLLSFIPPLFKCLPTSNQYFYKIGVIGKTGKIGINVQHINNSKNKHLSAHSIQLSVLRFSTQHTAHTSRLTPHSSQLNTYSTTTKKMLKDTLKNLSAFCF